MRSQTCSAASRILVQRGVYERVLAGLADRYRALKVGPAIDDLNVGPLISAKQHQIVQSYFDLAGQTGAEVVARGSVIDQPAVRRSLFRASPCSPGSSCGQSTQRKRFSGRCRW